MNKKEQIIDRIMDGYIAYVQHSGGICQKEYVRELLNRIIIFKGRYGYHLRINERYTADMSSRLYENPKGHYDWFEIGSFIDFGAWYIAKKLVRIDTNYKKEL